MIKGFLVAAGLAAALAMPNVASAQMPGEHHHYAKPVAVYIVPNPGGRHHSHVWKWWHRHHAKHCHCMK